MTDGGQDFDLGQVVGDSGEKGDDGSTIWYTSTAPTYANSKYTFTISNLTGKTGFEIAVNDIIFYSTYYYIVSTVGSTTVDCTTRVSIKGSDASVTIVDNLTSTSSTSALSAKQGKVLNDNKVATSSIATSFGSPTSDSKVPSEKLTKDSLDAKQATLISGTNIKTINNNSILGSGNIDIQSSSVDIATSWGSTLSDTKVPSEKLTKNSLDAKADSSSLATVATTGDYDDLTDKPTIPSKISDLQNDSDFIETSSTSGLVKNDGTIDTNSYLTSSSLSNYVQKSSTAGLLKNDGTVDTTSYSTFSGSYNDLSNKPTIPSLNVFYGTSSTSASTQVKEVTATGWSFTTGNVLFVKFDNANSYNGTAQIKIGSTTKDIAISGTAKVSRYHWIAGEVVGFVYDGTSMVMIDDGLATTTYYGVTKLSSSTSSTSESVAATPKAVKTAYDLADGKLGSGDVGAAALSNSYADLDNKPSIPASSSDLSDGSDLVKTSSTSGLIKNDGTIDTTSYSTFSGSYNDLSNKPTIPSKVSDLTNDSDFIETSSTEGVIANDGSIIEIGTTQGTVAAGNHTHSNYISGTKVTSWSGSVSDSNIPSEKLVKNTLDDKISKSSTAGLIKNDGSVDTNTYLTSSSLSNYVQKSSTSGLIKNDGTIDTNTYLTSSSITGMLTSSDIADNLTTNDSTKVLSAKQGKALKDLIGAAITYINQ